MPQISISTSEAIEPTLREVAKDSARKIHTEYHKNSSPLFYRYSDTESFPSNLANLYGSIFNGYFSMHHENKEIVLLWGSEEVDPVLGWNKNVLYRQRELFNHISSDYIQDVDFDAKHWQCPLFSNRDVIIPFGVKHAYITTSRKRENRNSTITLASSARVDSLVVEADRFFIKEHVELRAKFLKLNIKNIKETDWKGKVYADVLILNGEKHQFSVESLVDVKEIVANVSLIKEVKLLKEKKLCAENCNKRLIDIVAGKGLHIKLIDCKKITNYGVIHAVVIRGDVDCLNAGIIMGATAIDNGRFINRGIVAFVGSSNKGGGFFKTKRLDNSGVILGVRILKSIENWSNKEGYIISDGDLSVHNIIQNTGEILISRDCNDNSKLQIFTTKIMHTGKIYAQHIEANNCSIKGAKRHSGEIYTESFKAKSSIERKISLNFKHIRFYSDLYSSKKPSVGLMANKVLLEEFTGLNCDVTVKRSFSIKNIGCNTVRLNTQNQIYIVGGHTEDDRHAILSILENGEIKATKGIYACRADINNVNVKISTEIFTIEHSQIRWNRVSANVNVLRVIYGIFHSVNCKLEATTGFGFTNVNVNFENSILDGAHFGVNGGILISKKSHLKMLESRFNMAEIILQQCIFKGTSIQSQVGVLCSDSSFVDVENLLTDQFEASNSVGEFKSIVFTPNANIKITDSRFNGEVIHIEDKGTVELKNTALWFENIKVSSGASVTGEKTTISCDKLFLISATFKLIDNCCLNIMQSLYGINGLLTLNNATVCGDVFELQNTQTNSSSGLFFLQNLLIQEGNLTLEKAKANIFGAFFKTLQRSEINNSNFFVINAKSENSSFTLHAAELSWCKLIATEHTKIFGLKQSTIIGQHWGLLDSELKVSGCVVRISHLIATESDLDTTLCDIDKNCEWEIYPIERWSRDRKEGQIKKLERIASSTSSASIASLLNDSKVADEVVITFPNDGYTSLAGSFSHPKAALIFSNPNYPVDICDLDYTGNLSVYTASKLLFANNKI